MDSGNNSSGSIQSSSGGDIEEYDSRAESSSSFFAFLNNQVQPPPSSHDVGPFSSTTSNNLPNSHPLFLPPQQYRHNHMFEYPLSNYLDPIQRATPPPPLPNLDAMWSKLPARSKPIQTDLSGLMPCSSSSSPQNQTNPFVATHHTLLPSESGLVSVSESAAANNTAATAANNNVVRNPKKRSRASRRAPTTVLTTDTTNFRAMVQEFTGIPAPPFTSSPFPRTRLDLFASSSPSSSTIRSTRLDPSPILPPYLLRPFAQKLTHQQHLHPFPPSTTINSTQPLSNFHMHNSGLPFQATLQQPQKYPLGDSSVLASKTTHLPSSLEIPPSSADNSHIKMGVFEELGLRHEHHDRTANCLHQNAVLSQSVGVGALSSGNNNNNLTSNVVASSSTEWAQRITGTITNNDCDHHGGGRGGGGGGGFSGTVNYNDVAERVTNGKVHYSASSSDFHGEKKGPAECTTVAAAARSQGMVESWIN